MKNSKVYKMLSFLLVTIILIGTIICMVYDHRIDRILTYLSAIPVVLIPIVVNKFIQKTDEKEKFIYYLFVFLAYFLGSVVNLYNKTLYYDSIVHFLSGIYTMYIALNIYKTTKNCNFLIKFIFCFGLVFLVAGVWEILEYSIDTLFNTNLQHNIEEGVKDTMDDMIVAAIGGTITYIISLIRKK